MFLARKITMAKWYSQNGLEPDEISADAVTADLRTRDNALSFWQCDGTDNEVEEVALAIAAAGNRVDKLDIVWISKEELQAEGQHWLESEGRTPVTNMVERHLDVCRLDYVRLGKIARCIANAIREDRYKRLTKKNVLRLLVSAAKQRRVDMNCLGEKVYNEVHRSL